MKTHCSMKKKELKPFKKSISSGARASHCVGAHTCTGDDKRETFRETDGASRKSYAKGFCSYVCICYKNKSFFKIKKKKPYAFCVGEGVITYIPGGRVNGYILCGGPLCNTQ